MRSLLKKMVMILLFMFGSVSYATTATQVDLSERNYFQFSISKYHTTRQNGQVVNIYVKYAYQKDLPITKYPDYRLLRTSILHYLEPTTEFPADVYWEILATKMGKDLMQNFPLAGVSIQLYVLDNPNGNEPSDHGPIFTIGDITPLDVQSSP